MLCGYIGYAVLLRTIPFVIAPRYEPLITYHYNDFIMGAMEYQITSITIVYSTMQIKENIKAPRH